MILIGQFDSPFVRRVAIAMKLYGLPFEHRPWSTFGDADKIAPFNPLRRVPTLVLDDGECLIESGAILDALDEMAAPDTRLIEARGAARRKTLRLCALGSGLADKAVSLVYERLVHARATAQWVERCETQIGGVLQTLEAERAQTSGPWWFGERMTHGDIMAACALRFLAEAHPDLWRPSRWPALAAHAAQCDALDAFRSSYQAFQGPPESPQ